MHSIRQGLGAAMSGNPLVAIGLAIGVAFAMVMTTFTIFINSGAYITVRQIQVGTKVARSLQGSNMDTRSPIKADDIGVYQKELSKRMGTIDDTADFGQADISDQALGLTL